MKKGYKPQIGDPFEMTEIIEAKRSLLQEWTRTIIALAIVGAILAALTIAAIYGDQINGQAVLKVWGVVSVPLSGVIGYYLGRKRIGGENDN